MPLHYLDFDHSDDDHGNGSWDALASVGAQHLPALLQEVAQVLAWAHAQFGDPQEDGGDWHYALQALGEDGAPPPQVHYHPALAQVQLWPTGPGAARTTLAFTLCGSAAFGAALCERWGL